MKTNEIRIGSREALEAHTTIAGGRTGLREVIDRAASAGATTLAMPVTKETIHRIEGVFLLAAERGVPLRFDPVDPLNERETAFFDDFVRHRQTTKSGKSETLGHLLGEGAAVLGDLAKAATRALPVRAAAPLREARLPRVVLIGAYGGDHVGDAAILGGVLHTLHATYGTTDAAVMSFRHEHTRRLANGLDTPVRLSVHDYDPAIVDGLLDGSQALVVAGGPLMDLPRILVKHLAAVGAAQARGLPFIIERVGVGPFKRRASQWAARRIARSAAKISVRTSGAAADPILTGLNVTIGRDPAFDYLATRKTLTLLTEEERRSVASLLDGTAGRLLIGINLRPIRHLWSKKGEDYSRTSEGQFFERFARALVEFSRASSRPVTYVFFPMNPIQFGASDLASAFRLHQLVGADAEMRVWEADPDVDGVIHMLRQLHVAITMRFHACIFALAQDMPVLGVDYYPGRGGKVEELFGDLGAAEDVRRIDTLETAWLVERLHACSARVKGV